MCLTRPPVSFFGIKKYVHIFNFITNVLSKLFYNFNYKSLTSDLVECFTHKYTIIYDFKSSIQI